MPVVDLPNLQFLRKEYIDSQVAEKVAGAARARTRFGEWLAEFLNNWTINNLTNGWSTTFTTNTRATTILTRETDAGYEDTLGHLVIQHNNTTYGWDDAQADPVGD